MREVQLYPLRGVSRSGTVLRVNEFHYYKAMPIVFQVLSLAGSYQLSGEVGRRNAQVKRPSLI